MANGKLEKWEIAMLLSIVITLLFGLFFGEVQCCAWWGAVYPELTPAGSAAVSAAATASPGGYEIRFRALEWLQQLVGR